MKLIEKGNRRLVMCESGVVALLLCGFGALIEPQAVAVLTIISTSITAIVMAFLGNDAYVKGKASDLNCSEVKP